MSTHNIRFYGELTKIILQLSSNTLLICSDSFYSSDVWPFVVVFDGKMKSLSAILNVDMSELPF